MVSKEATERVLNTLVTKLKDNSDVESAELLTTQPPKIRLVFNVSKDTEEVQSLVETVKASYLYNQTEYTIRVPIPEHVQIGTLEADVRIVILDKSKL